MNTWNYMLAGLVALAGCGMSKTPLESQIDPIAQQKIEACKRLVAWVIAREEEQNSQFWWVSAHLLGTVEAVQIQRDPKTPQELYSIKAVRLPNWNVVPYSMWNGIWGETGKGIDQLVNENAAITLGSPQEYGKIENEPPKIVPTCSYKNGKYLVDGASNFPNYRYTVVTQGL
jgi:hypothetical protein